MLFKAWSPDSSTMVVKVNDYGSFTNHEDNEGGWQEGSKMSTLCPQEGEAPTKIYPPCRNLFSGRVNDMIF